ncbi:MAG: mechanosensitive ion channel [Turneriella sp.]|nr:mechanosensitive ion channel [Turneriella sp.]
MSENTLHAGTNGTKGHSGNSNRNSTRHRSAFCFADMMNDIIRFIAQHPASSKLAALIAGTIAIWIIMRYVRRLLTKHIADNAGRYTARKTANAVGFLLLLLLIAALYVESFAKFSMALGVAGAGIAFALQEVIASFAGWLAILFGGFYKPGDRVQLGGIKGDVIDVGVLRTTLMETGQWVDGDLYNGRIVLVANSFIFKEPVFNYSGEFPFLWDEIKVPVMYGSDYARAQDILLNAGSEHATNLSGSPLEKWKDLQNKFRLEDAQTDPMVSITANDNWVEMTLRYIVDYKLRRITKTRLFTQILADVEKTRGKVKMASATHQIVGIPKIQVSLKKK